jgi:hypothetical protein
VRKKSTKYNHKQEVQVFAKIYLGHLWRVPIAPPTAYVRTESGPDGPQTPNFRVCKPFFSDAKLQIFVIKELKAVEN